MLKALHNTKIQWMIILSIAVVARVSKLDMLNLWYDEIVSLSISTGYPESASHTPLVQSSTFTSDDYWNKNSLKTCYAATQLDNGNNLVFNVLLHFWINIFGFSLPVLRLLPVLFGIGSVILVYYLARLFSTNDKVASLSALLVACDPILIAYSYELRSYSQAAFFVLAATWVLFLVLKNKQTGLLWYLLYGALVALSFFSHFLTAYMFLVHGLIVLLYAINRWEWKYIKFILSGAVFAIAILLWYTHGGKEGLAIMSMQNAKWVEKFKIIKQTDALVFSASEFIQYSVRNALLLCRIPLPLYTQSLWVQLSFLLVPCICIFLFLKDVRKLIQDHLDHLALLMLAGSCLIYSMVMYVVNAHTVSFWIKYSVFAMPYIAVVLAVVLYNAWVSKLFYVKYAMLGVIGVGQVLYLYTTFVSNQSYSYPHDRIAKSILEQRKDNDTIVYASWHTAYKVNWYLRKHNEITQKVDDAYSEGDVFLVRGTRKLKIATDRSLDYP